MAWWSEVSDPDEKEPRPTGQEVMVEETRRVLDRQADEIEHIDNKAARTVRYIVLILGVLASAYSFAPGSLSPTWITGLGVIALSFAMLVGVFTYTNTRIWVGAPSTALSLDADVDPPAAAVWGELLQEYPSKVNANRDLITGDAAGLFVTQLLFVGGATAVAVDLLLV